MFSNNWWSSGPLLTYTAGTKPSELISQRSLPHSNGDQHSHPEPQGCASYTPLHHKSVINFQLDLWQQEGMRDCGNEHL